MITSGVFRASSATAKVAADMTSEERIKRAAVRLDSSTEGKFAGGVEEGASLREVIHSYGLSFQQIEDLRAIQPWL